MITDSGKSMLVVGALILIPFISLIVGRLRSLAIDFVGSAISLMFSFFDAAVQVTDELIKDPDLRSHASAVVYVVVYVVLVMLVGSAACVRLQHVYDKGRSHITGNSILEVVRVEIIYWIAVCLSVVLLLFTFSLNIGCREFFIQNDASSQTLYAFFRNVYDQYRKMDVVFWSTAVVLVLCAALKYVPSKSSKRSSHP